MCVVSMVGDHYNRQWGKEEWYKKMIEAQEAAGKGILNPSPHQPLYFPTPITREEFDALKKEVENMKALLIRAKLYDEQNNEPNCEIDEKMATLKKVAELFGVDLSEILKK